MTHAPSLRYAIEAAKAGDPLLARTHLQRAAQADPDDPSVWLWMGWLADSPLSMIHCLEKVLSSEQSDCTVVAEHGLAFARALAGSSALQDHSTSNSSTDSSANDSGANESPELSDEPTAATAEPVAASRDNDFDQNDFAAHDFELLGHDFEPDDTVLIDDYQLETSRQFVSDHLAGDGSDNLDFNAHQESRAAISSQAETSKPSTEDDLWHSSSSVTHAEETELEFDSPIRASSTATSAEALPDSDQLVAGEDEPTGHNSAPVNAATNAAQDSAADFHNDAAAFPEAPALPLTQSTAASTPAWHAPAYLEAHSANTQDDAGHSSSDWSVPAASATPAKPDAPAVFLRGGRQQPANADSVTPTQTANAARTGWKPPFPAADARTEMRLWDSTIADEHSAANSSAPESSQTVTSEVAINSTAVASLADTSADNAGQTTSASVTSVSSVPTPAASSGPQTILVVDDSATVRKLVQMTLEKNGYRVVSAFDGVAAIKEIAAHSPSLILMDVNMPRLDGYQLCKLVKKHDSTKHIPVVMLSGKDGMFDRLRGRLVGCSGYITKPFAPESLTEAVGQYLAAGTN